MGGSSNSSSSFTTDLFGPKDSSPPSSSSAGLFGSVFGPASTGLGKDYSHSGITGPTRKQNLESQYVSAKSETQEYMTQRRNGENGGKHNNDRSSNYQNETVEPCYFNSSIYYGGQQVYSPDSQEKNSPNSFNKIGDDDSNGSNSNTASRGNWWQGSLYY